MNDLELPIDGKLIILKVHKIEISDLLADEDNPRIGLFKDNQPKNTLTQEEIKYAIKNKSPEAYSKLKDSIHNNKGILNPIWVENFPNGKYKVIEGNSRLSIYQDLRKIEPNESHWGKIICYVLPQGTRDEEKNYIRLQAHLRGTNDWDAYEKAKYLFKLSNEDLWPISKIEKQTKLTKREIEQNIEAFKMMSNQYLPSHPDPFEIGKFSYFVEYVKDNKLKRTMSKNNLADYNFCEWVGDRNKIPTGQDVRKLKDIIDDDFARDKFLSEGFESSMEILAYRKPDLTNPLYRDIERVIDRLKEMQAWQLEEISNDQEGEKKRMLADLVKWSTKIFNLIHN
ncbi:MAG: ParB/Srx family N-terminal domain-containing protein [Cyclobacteriaceae bacterium]